MLLLSNCPRKILAVNLVLVNLEIAQVVDITVTLNAYNYRSQRSCEGYVFTGVCLSMGGAIPACIAGGIPACLAAGLQEGVGGYPSMPCRFPGPHPRGKFRGIRSRPTAMGEVEGDPVQAHSQRGS